MKASMAALTVAAVAIVACGDYQLLTPQPTKPQLGVSLAARRDSVSLVSAVLQLYTGTGADGRRYVFDQPGVWFNSTLLAPHPVEDVGYRYEFSGSPTPVSAVPDSFVVIGPPLNDAPADSVRMATSVPARLDPYNISVSPGQDLVVHLTPQAQMGWPARAVNQWTLYLTPSCDQLQPAFIVEGYGGYPDEFRVSRSQIPASLTGAFEACLRMNVAYSSVTTPYRALVGQSLDVRWRVTLTP